jgi:hypothetical protein
VAALIILCHSTPRRSQADFKLRHYQFFRTKTSGVLLFAAMENAPLSQPAGFVKGLKWTAEQLDEKTVLKCMATPKIMVPGKLWAESYKDGMILYVVFSNSGEEIPIPVSQAEANAITLNPAGEFEIPWG